MVGMYSGPLDKRRWMSGSAVGPASFRPLESGDLQVVEGERHLKHRMLPFSAGASATPRDRYPATSIDLAPNVNVPSAGTNWSQATLLRQLFRHSYHCSIMNQLLLVAQHFKVPHFTDAAGARFPPSCIHTV